MIAAAVPCVPHSASHQLSAVAIRRYNTSVTLRVQRLRQTMGEVNRRGARTAAAVKFERPSRLVHLANDRPCLLKRRRVVRKVEGIRTDSSDA